MSLPPTSLLTFSENREGWRGRAELCRLPDASPSARPWTGLPQTPVPGDWLRGAPVFSGGWGHVPLLWTAELGQGSGRIVQPRRTQDAAWGLQGPPHTSWLQRWLSSSPCWLLRHHHGGACWLHILEQKGALPPWAPWEAGLAGGGQPGQGPRQFLACALTWAPDLAVFLGLLPAGIAEAASLEWTLAL